MKFLEECVSGLVGELTLVFGVRLLGLSFYIRCWKIGQNIKCRGAKVKEKALKRKGLMGHRFTQMTQILAERLK
jgi:hypothetical protein